MYAHGVLLKLAKKLPTMKIGVQRRINTVFLNKVVDQNVKTSRIWWYKHSPGED